ncbi:MAG: respiratory nitrate reductase subunit gamma [Chloroflexi bacterium]|nr:respiratory nitrate reductase subunit gamma [Chloroflexota bacterium]
MTLESFMIYFGWAAAVLFFVVAGFRIYRIATMPKNLRWEVYPVPHEAEERRQYGGSYMEEVDWTKKAKHGSVVPEFLEMGTEIFALKKVRENNVYGIWPFSMAMHWGIYLYFGWLALLLARVLFPFGALSYAATAVGLASFVLGAFGSLALIAKRASNPDLAQYTAPIDYFNLLFLASFFVLGLISWLGDPSLDAHAAYISSVLFFKPTSVPAVVLFSFLVFEAFMIYMPFTKLIHYFAKYFTFHHSLWDDAFSSKGSLTDRKIVEQLSYSVRWSAPHIVAGKTWLEQAQNAAIESDKK